MFSRLLFTLIDVVILLAFGYVVFGVRCQGNYLELTIAVLLGGFSFAGIGLLVASRAQTVETISGLMNLVMLPMWIFSGVFFSASRFPDALQPFIQILPLTAVNDALRATMLEGAGPARLGPELAVIGAWLGVSFFLALRLFRWR
jgi:ABC-type polysaccharide/polyol phosphate export permease